jgi:hypothetical protein
MSGKKAVETAEHKGPWLWSSLCGTQLPLLGFSVLIIDRTVGLAPFG